MVEAGQEGMALGERVVRVVLVVVGEAATSMSTMRGIHQILVAYRILRTSLEVLRLMGKENLLMDMAGIKHRGVIGLLQGMVCEYKISSACIMVDEDPAWV